MFLCAPAAVCLSPAPVASGTGATAFHGSSTAQYSSNATTTLRLTPTELARDRLFERGLEPGCAVAMPEDQVPALHVGADVLAAEHLDQRPQVGHRHPVARAEVDRAEKRRVRRHWCRCYGTLSR